MKDRQYPLYHQELEHESCGVGAIVDLSWNVWPIGQAVMLSALQGTASAS